MIRPSWDGKAASVVLAFPWRRIFALVSPHLGRYRELLAVNIYLLVCCYAPIKLAQKLEISIELECEGLKDLGRRVKDINFHNLGGVFHWGRTFHGEWGSPKMRLNFKTKLTLKLGFRNLKKVWWRALSPFSPREIDTVLLGGSNFLTVVYPIQMKPFQ